MKAVNKGLALQSDVHWRGRGQVDWKKGEVSRKLNSLEGLKQEQDLGVDPGISLWPRMRVWGNCCLSAFRRRTRADRWARVRVSFGRPDSSVVSRP